MRERARQIVLAMNGGKATTAQMELLQLELIRVQAEERERIISRIENEHPQTAYDFAAIVHDGELFCPACLRAECRGECASVPNG